MLVKQVQNCSIHIDIELMSNKIHNKSHISLPCVLSPFKKLNSFETPPQITTFFPASGIPSRVSFQFTLFKWYFFPKSPT